MANLDVKVVCGECEKYDSCSSGDNVLGGVECPTINNVGLTEDGQSVIWIEDLDTVIMNIDEISQLAGMLGYEVTKKEE
jgi:protein-tyrosine phosphatase